MKTLVLLNKNRSINNNLILFIEFGLQLAFIMISDIEFSFNDWMYTVSTD